MTEQKEIDNTNEVKISVHDFYFETPLYDTIEIKNINGNFKLGDVDAYSAKNQIETTYSISLESMSQGYGRDGYCKITLECKRKNNDKIRFFIIKNDTHVMKVGQNPSLADLQFASIGKKYDKYMNTSDLHDFKKAIGLAAHGVGAGSFVYLRRIFENLIYKAYITNKQEMQITDEDFYKKKMDEKVIFLKKYLPSQLVEMKEAYSILSKGVHELTEEECLEYFGILKLSIQLVLDQKIGIDIQNKKDEDTKKELQKIHQKLKVKNTSEK